MHKYVCTILSDMLPKVGDAGNFASYFSDVHFRMFSFLTEILEIFIKCKSASKYGKFQAESSPKDSHSDILFTNECRII